MTGLFDILCFSSIGWLLFQDLIVSYPNLQESKKKVASDLAKGVSGKALAKELSVSSHRSQNDV